MGDDCWSIGLLFDVEPVPGKKVSRKSPANRHERPQSEWTPNDVATEFRDRIEQALPGTRGFMPVGKNGVYLAVMRKRLGTNADLEMILLELFLGDEWNLTKISNDPAMAYRLWVSTWSKNMRRAREACGLDPLGTSAGAARSESKGLGDIGDHTDPQEPSAAVLYASDGTPYPNTPLGRRRLERLEATLRAEAGEAQ